MRCCTSRDRLISRSSVTASHGALAGQGRCPLESGHRLGKRQVRHAHNLQLGLRGNTPEQRVAASTLRQYILGLRLAIAQADARLVVSMSLR